VKVMYERVAGIDVHKKMIKVAVRASANRDEARRPPGPSSVQETDTSAHSSSSGSPPGRPRHPDYHAATNGPRENGDDGRRATATVHLPPCRPQRKHHENPGPRRPAPARHGRDPVFVPTAAARSAE